MKCFNIAYRLKEFIRRTFVICDYRGLVESVFHHLLEGDPVLGGFDNPADTIPEAKCLDIGRIGTAQTPILGKNPVHSRGCREFPRARVAVREMDRERAADLSQWARVQTVLSVQFQYLEEECMEFQPGVDHKKGEAAVE